MISVQQQAIIDIARRDGRYSPEAFFFVYEALEYTLHRIGVPEGARHHVSGQQLLDGIRTLALERFGLLAYTALSRWGITKTDDFGDIVFMLVENEKMSRTDEDSLEDFHDRFDLAEALDSPEALRFVLKDE